jgi:hypothetical protein
MTKHRPPSSLEAALVRIAGMLGDYDAMGAVVGASGGYLRACGDPDKRERLSIEHGLALDIAFRERGGIGAPVYEFYTFQLELAETDKFALPIQLLHLAPEVMRDNNEVEIALVNAARPDATEQDRRLVAKEADDVIARMQQVKTAVLPPRVDQPHQTGPPD